jgi:hypothetical protein
MEKQAKARHLPFLNSWTRARKRYSLEMTKDEFIEEAYNVWREIGNQAPVVSRYFTQVPEDFIIELPSDMEFLDGVMIINEPIPRDSFTSEGRLSAQRPAYFVETVTPGENQSLQSVPNGKSVNYVLVGDNAIKITSPNTVYRDLLIIYRSMVVGEDGLPLLNDKEVAAIAAEVARRDVVREAFRGVQTKAQLLQFISKEADRLMLAAKVDEYINDDAIDQILDTKTTFDRKVYGRRFNLYN